jgi:hypothetical protein
MPNIKQQKKRVRIAAGERLENLRYVSTVKTFTRRLAPPSRTATRTGSPRSTGARALDRQGRRARCAAPQRRRPARSPRPTASVASRLLAAAPSRLGRPGDLDQRAGELELAGSLLPPFSARSSRQPHDRAARARRA